MKKFLAAVAVVLCLAACQNDNGGDKFKTSTVAAFAGGVFYVEITANLTTGYSWNITNAENLQYVKLTSVENITKKSDDKAVGQPSVQRFDFSVNPGTSGKTEVLKFAYFRPWETGVAPLEQKTYTVNIQ